MLEITLGNAVISKLGVYKGSGMVLSGVYFWVTCVGNLESVGPGEGDPLVNS